MITARRSDFFYTLEEDERKCLAQIEEIDQRIKKRLLINKKSGHDEVNVVH